MNVYDSDKIRQSFENCGYEIADSVQDADVIILNTCSIREKACQKAFSFLGRVKKLKINKQVTIGVCGCLAEQEGANIIERMPYVDFVAGVNAIYRMPEIVKKAEDKKCRPVDTGFDSPAGEPLCQTSKSRVDISEFVTIMRGCDNFCSYCVVPHVRGREISRKPKNIINEIKMLVANGACEITLLGQNVNSYGKKEGSVTFERLIELVNEIEGLKRIRFTTSHPKDLGDNLIEAFKKFEKLCPHIHLPVQSGSDAVLKRMNRKYTIKDYIEKIEKLRKTVPNIAVTSDLIVGFCQETQEDFNMTLNLIKHIQFDGIFAFAYSPRPNTLAQKFKDTASEQEKKERLYSLFNLQEYYTKKKNAAFVGTEQKTLAEGLSKRGLLKNEKKEWTGRTDTNKIVNFITSKDDNPTGKIVNVKIEKTFSHSLWGIL